MLAPPTPRQALKMYQGGSEWRLYLKALTGPFYGDFLRVYSQVFGGPGPGGLMLMMLAAVAVLVSAIALVTFIPTREVTQSPHRWHWVVETLLPGIAPQWSVWGGPIFLSWCYFVIQALSIFNYDTANIIARISLPNIARSYAISEVPFAEVLRLINPGLFWVYGLPALLFAF